MTTTDTEAPPTVEQTAAALAAAVTEDEQAAGALATVERAIAGGDTSVTAEDLAEARALARFAALRRVAATERHTRSRRDEVAAQVAASAATGVPKPDETPDETRARHEAAYDHTHDPDGHPIQLQTVQDAAAPACGTCRRYGPVEGWQHAFDCPAYTPHPASIAAHTLNGATP